MADVWYVSNSKDIYDEKTGKYFHDDSKDREWVKTWMMPDVEWTTSRFDSCDGYDGNLGIEVKNRMDYPIGKFKTTLIDRKKYDFLLTQDRYIVIIFYPVDRKILVYNKKTFEESYVNDGKIWAWSETGSDGKNDWRYIQKTVSYFKISGGKIYDYEYFTKNS